MVFMEWTEELSVGSTNIDAQHKVLVNYLNELDDAISQGKNEAVLEKILNGLVDYTILHFDYEEHQLEKSNYPDIKSHKAEHADLKATVLGFKEQFETHKFKMGSKVLDFLKSWLVDHIMLTDKNYAEHLKQQPV